MPQLVQESAEALRHALRKIMPETEALQGFDYACHIYYLGLAYLLGVDVEMD